MQTHFPGTLDSQIFPSIHIAIAFVFALSFENLLQTQFPGTLDSQISPSIHIAIAFVIMARARLTLNKASGVDGVVSEMLKELPLIIVYLVTYAFQERYMDPQSTPLHAWLQIILVFIPKGIIPRVPDMKIHWNLLAQCPGQMVQHGFSYAIGRRATTIPLEENLSRRR